MSNGSKRVIRAKLAREHKKINIVKRMTLEECFEKYIFAKRQPFYSQCTNCRKKQEIKKPAQI